MADNQDGTQCDQVTMTGVSSAGSEILTVPDILQPAECLDPDFV
jgi:hypothetical protein